MTDKETIQHLEKKISNQKWQLELLNESLREKNLALDALHYVWCSGGCGFGVHRDSDGKVTKEIVEKAKHNTNRLITWYNNSEFHKLKDDSIPEIKVSLDDVWFYFRIVAPRKFYHKVLKFFAQLVKY
jgi:hypothetical protein